jgi:hypothetical protein
MPTHPSSGIILDDESRMAHGGWCTWHPFAIRLKGTVSDSRIWASPLPGLLFLEGLPLDPHSLCTITAVRRTLLYIHETTDCTTAALLTMALFSVRTTVLEATRYNILASGSDTHCHLDGCTTSLSSNVRCQVSSA